jgi:tetraacyldisaccharide 4'-kinase
VTAQSWQVRLVRRLWRRRSWKARAARGLLLPLAAAYGGVVGVRRAWYRAGLSRPHSLPLPSVAVGNLSVGGTGKTPLVALIARHYLRAGRRPGILLRGYGRDEVLLHRRHVPEAVVIANPDRVAGAMAAQGEGADILVLDDAFQTISVERDLNIAVLGVEQSRLSPWLLPAGPWREGERALRRADLLVVTRKRAAGDAAAALANRLAARWPGTPVAVARLSLTALVGMRSGERFSLTRLEGQRVLAAAAIADPESFAVQVRASGATVQLAAYQDHHEYDAADVTRLVQAAQAAGYLVVTEKDAVKLRGMWPADGPEPLVAILEWTWERNGEAVAHALDRVLVARRGASSAPTDTHT